MPQRVLKGSAKLMQKLNTSLILETLKESGPISRAELAKRTRLSNPAVSTLISRLMEEGLVEEIEQPIPQAAAQRLLQFNPRPATSLSGHWRQSHVRSRGGYGREHRSAEELSFHQRLAIGRHFGQPHGGTLGPSGTAGREAPRCGLGYPRYHRQQRPAVSYAPAIGWDDFDIGAVVARGSLCPFLPITM